MRYQDDIAALREKRIDLREMQITENIPGRSPYRRIGADFPHAAHGAEGGFIAVTEGSRGINARYREDGVGGEETAVVRAV
jgi:hypothetical protein